MATGVSAVRSGIVMFVIPFVFAMYPSLLLIEAAVLDPAASGAGKAYLPGHDGRIHLDHLFWLLARLSVALYLLASALARFDRIRLELWEVAARLALAVAMVHPSAYVNVAAIGLAGALVLTHMLRARRDTGRR